MSMQRFPEFSKTLQTTELRVCPFSLYNPLHEIGMTITKSFVSPITNQNQTVLTLQAKGRPGFYRMVLEGHGGILDLLSETFFQFPGADRLSDVFWAWGYAEQVSHAACGSRGKA